MMKPDWIKAIDEAIEAKQRIYAMTTPDRDRFDKNVEKAMIDIRPMNEIESLQSLNQALTARVRQLECALASRHSYADGLHSECNDLMFAIQGAMPWMILLGDYIGNGTKDDPMGRCNAILKMNNALGRNDEEAIESGRVDIR